MNTENRSKIFSDLGIILSLTILVSTELRNKRDLQHELTRRSRSSTIDCCAQCADSFTPSQPAPPRRRFPRDDVDQAQEHILARQASKANAGTFKHGVRAFARAVRNQASHIGAGAHPLPNKPHRCRCPPTTKHVTCGCPHTTKHRSSTHLRRRATIRGVLVCCVRCWPVPCTQFHGCAPACCGAGT